jgi:hypothetical protein
LNPASAVVCDCSYDFTTGARDPAVEKQRREAREKYGERFAVGMVLMSLLLVMSILGAVASGKPFVAVPSIPVLLFIGRSYVRWRANR